MIGYACHLLGFVWCDIGKEHVPSELTQYSIVADEEIPARNKGGNFCTYINYCFNCIVNNIILPYNYNTVNNTWSSLVM